MEPALAGRQRVEGRGRWDSSVSTARPLVRPAPRSAMFFPLVVLVAVLPGLFALTSWDLTPPGPWWGLRGLAVLEGRVLDQVPATAELVPPREARAFRQVAYQPPLYAWLEALGLALSTDRDPLATVLPSYAAGVLVVLLVYWLGRLSRGPGLGLIAAGLAGFSRALLVPMQQATPATLALAGVLTVLYSYGAHRRAVAESSRAWGWGGAFLWAVLGGVALGLSLLVVGAFALLTLVVILFHQAYLRAGSPPGERVPWTLVWRSNASLRAGTLALVIGLAIAGPWHVMMFSRYGWDFVLGLLAPLDSQASPSPGLLTRLIELAPATLPLGLFAAVGMIRAALIDENDDREVVGGVLWLLWFAVAALLPVVWPGRPRALSDLFLLVPLILLAAHAIAQLASRQVSVRRLTWLAPLTAVSLAWWGSATLRDAVSDLWRMHIDAGTALGLHLALDLLIAVVLLTRRHDRWARRRDDRQRRVLGGFLLSILCVTVVIGLGEVRRQQWETSELLNLRRMILRDNRKRPFDVVAVVSPDRAAGEPFAPGGRLRFILRSALPHLPQRDLTQADDLLKLPPGQRLVILAGVETQPSYVQSRLGLERILDGRPGMLEAFATAHDPTREPRR
ncbi:MAG: glycosyltransferase family 39 protein [Isosphaeraceae bacterium]|nr:glycosyltransferase family 39 protein [Isosphaeraceae bacterium]